MKLPLPSGCLDRAGTRQTCEFVMGRYVLHHAISVSEIFKQSHIHESEPMLLVLVFESLLAETRNVARQLSEDTIP